MAVIHIDGTTVEVDSSDNLLQACLSLGIDVPYFCYYSALGSAGACRQCAVKQYQNKEDIGLVVTCLLNGAIIPETTVYLKSKNLTGFYKAVEVAHTGNFEGDGDSSWTTEMKLAEVEGKLISG